MLKIQQEGSLNLDDQGSEPIRAAEFNPYEPQELQRIFGLHLGDIQRRVYRELKVVNSLQVAKFKKFITDKDKQHNRDMRREKDIRDREIVMLKSANFTLQKQVMQMECRHFTNGRGTIEAASRQRAGRTFGDLDEAPEFHSRKTGKSMVDPDKSRQGAENSKRNSSTGQLKVMGSRASDRRHRGSQVKSSYTSDGKSENENNRNIQNLCSSPVPMSRNEESFEHLNQGLSTQQSRPNEGCNKLAVPPSQGNRRKKPKHVTHYDQPEITIENQNVDQKEEVQQINNKQQSPQRRNAAADAKAQKDQYLDSSVPLGLTAVQTDFSKQDQDKDGVQLSNKDSSQFDYNILAPEAKIYLKELEQSDHLELTFEIVKSSLQNDILKSLETLCSDFLKQIIHCKRNIKRHSTLKVLEYFKHQQTLQKKQMKQERMSIKLAQVKAKTEEGEGAVHACSHSKQASGDIKAMADLKFEIADKQIKFIKLKHLQIREIDQLEIKDDENGITDTAPVGGNGSLASTPCSHHQKQNKIEDLGKILDDPSNLISDRDLITKMKSQIGQLKGDLQQAQIQADRSARDLFRAEDEKKKAQLALNDARMKFTKDILNLQDQICQSRQHPDDFEFVNSSYLDLTDTFEESVKTAWNFHKKRVEDNFNEILYRSQQSCRVQRERNDRFQRLCDDGNQLIPISKMNADFIIGKLMMVEADPRKIWQTLENNYGAGYFNPVIEKVMGVTSDWKNQVYNEFREKILSTTFENERALNQLEKNVKQVVDTLRAAADEQQQNALKVREEYAEIFRAKAKEMEDALRSQHQLNVYKATEQLEKRCSRLSDKIVECELGSQKLRTGVQFFNLQHAMEKWKYAAKLRKIIQQVGDFYSKRFTEDAARQLNEELISLSTSLLTPKLIANNKYKSNVVLLDEMHKQFDQWSDRAEELERENQKIRIAANENIHKYNFSQVIITKQDAQIRELESKSMNLEQDIKKNAYQNELIRQSEQFKDQYIEYIEKEQTQFGLKLKKLSKNHPALAVFSRDPIQTLDEIRNRVQIRFVRKAQQVYANILGENQREKFCQTEMQGIHRVLEMPYIQKGELFHVKPTDKAIQCQADTRSRGVGTPFKEYQDQTVQTTTRQQDLQQLMKKIISFIQDMNAFESEQAKLRKEARKASNKGNNQDSFELLQHILKSNLLELQKNSEVKSIMAQDQVRKVAGVAPGGSKAAGKLKKLRATTKLLPLAPIGSPTQEQNDKHGKARGSPSGKGPSSFLNQQQAQADSTQSNQCNDGELLIHEVDEESQSESSSGQHSLCLSSASGQPRQVEGSHGEECSPEFRTSKQWKNTDHVYIADQQTKLPNQPPSCGRDSPHEASAMPAVVLFSSHKSRSSSLGHSREQPGEKADRKLSPESTMKGNYRTSHPSERSGILVQDQKYKSHRLRAISKRGRSGQSDGRSGGEAQNAPRHKIGSGTFDLQEAVLGSKSHQSVRSLKSESDRLAKSESTRKSREKLQELQEILSKGSAYRPSSRPHSHHHHHHTRKEETANQMSQAQASLMNSLTIEQQHQITKIFKSLIEEKPPVIKIEPKYTVNSSHSKILEKVLDRTYRLNIQSQDQQTQTDFDGVFIGKMNGTIDMGSLQSRNSGRNSGLWNPYHEKTYQDVFHSHRKLLGRPQTASQHHQKDRKLQNCSNQDKNYEQLEERDRIQVKSFDQLIRPKCSIPTKSSGHPDMTHQMNIYKEVMNDSIKDTYYSEKNNRLQSAHNRKKLEELRRQTGLSSFNSTTSVNSKKGSLFLRRKEVNFPSNDGKLKLLNINAGAAFGQEDEVRIVSPINTQQHRAGSQQGQITIQAKGNSSLYVRRSGTSSSKFAAKVAMQKNAKYYRDKQYQAQSSKKLRGKSLAQKSDSGKQQKNNKTSSQYEKGKLENGQLVVNQSYQQSESGGISGSASGWRTSLTTTTPLGHVQLRLKKGKANEPDSNQYNNTQIQSTLQMDGIIRYNQPPARFGNSGSIGNRISGQKIQKLRQQQTTGGISEQTTSNQESDMNLNAYAPLRQREQINSAKVTEYRQNSVESIENYKQMHLPDSADSPHGKDSTQYLCDDNTNAQGSRDTSPPLSIDASK